MAESADPAPFMAALNGDCGLDGEFGRVGEPIRVCVVSLAGTGGGTSLSLIGDLGKVLELCDRGDKTPVVLTCDFTAFRATRETGRFG